MKTGSNKSATINNGNSTSTLNLKPFGTYQYYDSSPSTNWTYLNGSTTNINSTANGGNSNLTLGHSLIAGSNNLSGAYSTVAMNASEIIKLQ